MYFLGLGFPVVSHKALFDSAFFGSPVDSRPGIFSCFMGNKLWSVPAFTLL